MSLEILSLTEAAIKTHLLTTVTTENVYTGKGNDDKEVPCIIVEASECSEYVKDTGVFIVSVAVRHKYRPATESVSLATANTAATEALQSLWDDDLHTSLTAAADSFTCQGVVSRTMDTDVDGDVWIVSAKLELICCPSDLS